MKYTKKIRNKGSRSHSFIFNPPEDAKRAGIVKRTRFEDGRVARHEIPKLIEKVEAYRRGELVVGNIGPTSRLQDCISYYLTSDTFRDLSRSSQENYEHCLSLIAGTNLGEKTLGYYKLNKISTKLCNRVFSQWAEERGAAQANRLKTIFSVLFKFLWRLELVEQNPMARIQSLAHEPTTYVWTQEQVEKLLSIAFEDFEYRNVGLLVLMCYEWAQRPIDIARLKWKNIDFDSKKVTIRQSKRGAVVTLPLEGLLYDLLEKQAEDFDFQPYVIPYLRRSDKAWRPMTRGVWSARFNVLKEMAGIPKELEIGYLRKTAINEMVEATLDSTSIMQVTGHKNISSLNPYMKHTLEGAKSALDKRKKHKDGSNT